MRRLAQARGVTPEDALRQWLDSAEAPARAGESAIYRSLFELTASMLCVVGLDGQLVEANPAFYTILGYEPGTLTNRPFLDLVHPDDRETALRKVRQSRERAEAVYVENDFLCDGGVKRLAWVPYQEAEHDLTYIVAFDVSARREAEQAVRASEARLAGILDSTMDAIITIGEDRRIILFNQAAERMFRCPASEAIGQRLDRFLPQRFHDVHSGHIQRFGASDTVHRAMAVPGIIHGQRADGEEFPIETSISQLVVNGQRLFTAIVRDVTESHRTERALRESEAYFQAIADDMPAALTISRVPDGTTLYANARAVSFAGLTREYLTGNQPDTLELDETQRLALSQMLAHGGIVGQKMRVRQPDGAVLWLLVSMRQIVYQGQDAVMAISLDITEQTQHEDRLRELAAIVEHSYDAIIGKTVEGRITSWNEGAERLYGYTDEEMIGESVLRLYPPERVHEEAELLAKMERGEVVANYETMRLRKDGERLDVSITISPLRDAHGVIVGGSVIAHDITQQRRQAALEEALAHERAVNELRSRFTSMVSHEFRTPLASILSSVELQQHYADRLTPERRTQQLAAIAEQVKRLTGMLDEMLLIGRAESVGLEFSPQPVDLEALCGAIAHEHGKLSARQVHFTLNGQPELRLLDLKLLRLIVGNLVSNALKYSANDTDIWLAVNQQEESVVLSVEDRGIGIPEHDQAQMFQAFHRAGNVSNTPGTGLGLTIVKQAVDAHRGSITFESEVGVGTRFIVTLPAPRPQ